MFTALTRSKSILSHLKDSRQVNTGLKSLSSFSSLNPLRTMSSVPSKSEVVFKRHDSARFIMLNRPSHLNALNTNMINLMTPQLEAWQYSDIVKVVILMPNQGSKAFCAGGDVKRITELAASGRPEDIEESLSFFKLEYKLNHLIGTFEKPFISIMDVGGGVGLSVHAPFRIATEKTVFAMPETKIGFFPDVGGSFFLPRLDGELGTLLGLTGEVLKGEEVCMAGIATHFVPSNRLPLLLAQLTQLETDNVEVINGLLNEYCGDTIGEDKWRKWRFGGENRKMINRCFTAKTVEEIIENLKKETNPLAEKILKDISARSPTSLKVTLMQLQEGKRINFRDAFKMELGMAAAFLSTKDFHEGVRSVLVDKDNKPKWDPDFSQLSSINVEQLKTKYFKAPSKLSKAIRFSNQQTYFDYPHRSMSSLPSVSDIKKVINGTAQRGRYLAPCNSKGEVRTWFQREWGAFDKSVIGTNTSLLPSTVSIENGLGRGNAGLMPKVNYLLDEIAEEIQDKDGIVKLKLTE